MLMHQSSTKANNEKRRVINHPAYIETLLQQRAHRWALIHQLLGFQPNGHIVTGDIIIGVAVKAV